jgi:hypothetical protein
MFIVHRFMMADLQGHTCLDDTVTAFQTSRPLTTRFTCGSVRIIPLHTVALLSLGTLQIQVLYLFVLLSFPIKSVCLNITLSGTHYACAIHEMSHFLYVYQSSLLIYSSVCPYCVFLCLSACSCMHTWR